MLKLWIKKGFAVRRRLIRNGQSYLDPKWAMQKMKLVEYWLATAPVERVVKHNYELIIILLPTNFISKFKEKCDGL